MRPQYHFEPSKRGLLAWNVARLVSLTQHFPVIEIPLSAIREIDESYWFANSGEAATCRKVAEHAKLINKVDLSYPIILFSNGRVADGMHRVCRALIEDHDTIKAVRFENDPEPDFIGVSPDDLPY